MVRTVSHRLSRSAFATPLTPLGGVGVRVTSTAHRAVISHCLPSRQSCPPLSSQFFHPIPIWTRVRTISSFAKPSNQKLASCSSSLQEKQSKLQQPVEHNHKINDVAIATKSSILNTSSQKTVDKNRTENASLQPEQVLDRSTLLLVGLGNPGDNFENTPHNIGFSLVSSFASSHGSSKFKFNKSVQSDVSTVHVNGIKVHVLKPTTYMNRSGAAIKAALKFWNVQPYSILIVTDDVALEVGRVRLRARGSSGGHNGLKSIQAALNGSQDYARLRIGVGAPSGGSTHLKDFVLRRFNKSDLKILQGVEIDVLNLLDYWVKESDITRVMNQLGMMQSGRKR